MRTTEGQIAAALALAGGAAWVLGCWLMWGL
jgi:hypothetical protein